MTTFLAKIVADFETQLSSKLSVGGTTCNLQSITDDDGVTLPNGTYFFTIDGDNSQKEHIVATITGTALSAIKTISRQGVQASGAVREHRIGASVKITDFAHIKYMNDLLDGTTGFHSGVKIGYDADPGINSSDLNKFATVTYVNGVAIAGAPDASTTVKGIVEEATTSEIDANTAAGGTSARLFVNPSALDLSKYGLRLPTANQKAALVGSSGAPTAENTYVTEDDVTVDGTGLSQSSQNFTYAVGEANATTKNNKIAQTFIAENASLISVQLHKLSNTGTNAGNVIVELYAVDGSGNPTGGALAAVTVSAAAYNALSNGLNTFTFASPYTATIGTTYAIQVSQSTADNSNHINLGVNTPQVYDNGLLKRWNATDGWVNVATGDLAFIFNGTTNSKIVRRTATGQVTVPTTPVATTDASSKSYVDSNAGTKISVVTTNVSLDTSVVETNLISSSIAGGTLSTNNAIRVTLLVSQVSNNASDTVTIRCKYGATTLTTQVITPGTAKAGKIVFYLFGSGATNTQEGRCEIFFCQESTSSSTALGQVYDVEDGTSAIDSTSNQTLAITAQWSNSHASNSIIVTSAIIEKIR